MKYASLENKTIDYRHRAVAEHIQLLDRIDKLTAFLSGQSSSLSGDEIDRLKHQLYHMCEYAKVLGQRIDGFPDE